MGQTKEKNILLLKKLIVSKCIKDPNFKKQFLENPKNALEKEFHVQLPNEMQIKALEESGQLLYVIVPSKAVIESGELEHELELSDEELKAISAGSNEAFNYWAWSVFEQSAHDLIHLGSEKNWEMYQGTQGPTRGRKGESGSG